MRGYAAIAASIFLSVPRILAALSRIISAGFAPCSGSSRLNVQHASTSGPQQVAAAWQNAGLPRTSKVDRRFCQHTINLSEVS